MKHPTSPVDWTSFDTRFVLFTGKGGVGKTTIAATAAVALADSRSRVLLVSTDPASNLADVFQAVTTPEPRPAPGVQSLDLMDLDPQAAADAYRKRVIAPYRGVAPPTEVAALEQQLAGACTVEVAAFDAFTRLLANPATRDGYHHVIFDTAPTGHTLRLLALPAAWSRYLAASPEESTCLGPLAGLQGQRPVYQRAVTVLADPDSTTLVLVSRPDRAALSEAARAGTELAAAGLTNQRLIINGVHEHPLAGDPVAEAYARSQHDAMADIPPTLAALATATLPLVGIDLVGLDALRHLARRDTTSAYTSTEGLSTTTTPLVLPAIGGTDDLVDTLAGLGPGVTLVTGKGGVGKTTLALRLAAGLAKRATRVHLATTDPAGRLPENLLPTSVTVSHIDPRAETERYMAERLSDVDTETDTGRLAIEDMATPCTTEVAVFRAFGRLLLLGRDRHVIIDTAPTGHTLLLLDVTGAFHRQVTHDTTMPAGRITTPLMRLQDPSYSRLILVTLPETTPVAEAGELQDDLRRAGIEPFGWVINASLAAATTADPVLRARAQLETPHISQVITTLAARAWLAAWDPAIYTGPAPPTDLATYRRQP